MAETGSASSFIGASSAEPPAPAPTVSDEREALRRLLGRKPARYLRAYERRRARGRSWTLGWCWSGLVFGTLWAYYRRLYAPILVMEGVLGLCGTVAAALALPSVARLGLSFAAIAAARALAWALLGRTLVVSDVLARWRRLGSPAPSQLVLHPRAGPLTRFRWVVLIAVLGGGVAATILASVLDIAPPLDPARQAAIIDALPSRQTAPLTGLLTVDVLLGLILGNLAVLTAAALFWRWAGTLWWPCAGAIVTGGMAATLVGLLPAEIWAPAFLLPPDLRLVAINYLAVAPVEEGLKLLLLAGVLLPAEPTRDRRALVAAVFLMAAGFELVENLAYLLPPVQIEEVVPARLLLPRHLLFATFTAVGLCCSARVRRGWVLALTWLAAAIAHGAFNVGIIVLSLRWWPLDALEAQAFLGAFGVHPERLDGEGWILAAKAQLAALGVAVVLAVLTLRRLLRAPAAEPR